MSIKALAETTQHVEQRGFSMAEAVNIITAPALQAFLIQLNEGDSFWPLISKWEILIYKKDVYIKINVF